MPKPKTFQALLLAAALAAAPVYAQDLQQIRDRQCAIEGTELYDFVSAQLPGCDYYCLVDKTVLPEYQNYPGEVFACVDRRDLAGLPLQEDDDGLGALPLGGLLGLGLLLGAAAGGNGGSTNNTQ